MGPGLLKKFFPYLMGLEVRSTQVLFKADTRRTESLHFRNLIKKTDGPWSPRQLYRSIPLVVHVVFLLAFRESDGLVMPNHGAAVRFLQYGRSVSMLNPKPC